MRHSTCSTPRALAISTPRSSAPPCNLSVSPCCYSLIGLETKNPTIFNMIASLDTEENQKGVTFDQFLDSITLKLGDRETHEGIDRIFDLFDDDKTGAISLMNLKRVAKELGETLSPDELKEILSRAATNGNEISREDFYNIMTKKTFP